MNGKIKASLCVLTRNSEATLERALASARDFDEILICDGGSTDSTREIAARFGARIIDQDASFRNSEGHIADFSGIRNQYLRAATHDWIFALDSDEWLSDELVREIREACAGEPAVYWVPRKYEFNGTVIERAMNYPSRQMRFFHRSSVSGYVKPVHERIAVRDGAPVRVFSRYMIVPVAAVSFEVVKRKWNSYIELERIRRSNISLRTWIYKTCRELSIMAVYAVRLVRVLLFQRGPRFPVSVEARIFWYQWRLIEMLFKKIDRL